MNKLSILITSVLTLFLLSVSPASAQEKAYLVTAAGDTLRGLVQHERNQHVTFRKIDTEEAVTFTANEVSGYGNEHGDHFVSKRQTPASQQASFFKLVVTGPVSLYYNNGLLPEADYYIQKQNEPLTQLHRQYFAGTLASLLGDCQTIAPHKTKYTSNSLTELVTAYNLCRYGSRQSLSYTNEKDKILVSAGVKAGLGYTNATFNAVTDQDNPSFESEIGFGMGAFLNFSKPGKQLSVQPELWFLQRNTGSKERFERPFGGSYTSIIRLDATLVQLPLLLKYNLTRTRLQPYLLAGPNLNFIVSNEAKNVVIFDTTPRPYDRGIGEPSAGIGFTGGAGMTIPVRQRQLLLELRYSQEHFTANSFDQNFSYKTLQLTAGIGF